MSQVLYDDWQKRATRFRRKRVVELLRREPLPAEVVAERFGLRPEYVRQISSDASLRILRWDEWSG